MDSKTASLLGAAAAFATTPLLATPANAEPPVPTASSYADLLSPIPNAVERLKIADAQDTATPAPRLIKAQFDHNHHHNHHHANHNRRWWLSHGYILFGGRWVTRDYYNHHHHHHHNNNHNHDHHHH